MFGGGVVCGFLYIGVLKVFEVCGILIEFVVGMSVGLVVGVFYVFGMNVL